MKNKHKQPFSIVYIGEVIKYWKFKQNKKANSLGSRCNLRKHYIQTGGAPSAVLIYHSDILNYPMTKKTQTPMASWAYVHLWKMTKTKNETKKITKFAYFKLVQTVWSKTKMYHKCMATISNNVTLDNSLSFKMIFLQSHVYLHT